MKRMLTVLLAILLILALGCALAEVQPTVYVSGDYKFVLLEDGTAEITYYTGKAQELVVPAELDGYRVTSIGTEAFYSCKSLTSVSIPDSVTSIGEGAFSSCKFLTSISVSPTHPTLAVIDGVLFEKSTKTLLCYPCAFTAKSYTIPQGIQIIGDFAFSSCDSLTSVSIPDSVTSIGEGAFYFCDSLTSISIPNSVISIGEGAFSFCRSLTSVSIPDSVTSIGEGAFSSCRSLTSVSIPDSVTTIGVRAFSSCYSLTSISVSPTHPTLAVIDGVLFEKSTKTLLCYPYTFTAKSYAIPQGTQIIGDGAFYYCASLTSVSIPDSITSIGDYAFYCCRSLTSVSIPDSVTSIGDAAFYYCRSLTSISIPASVTAIGENAFEGCPNITFTVERDSFADQWCQENGLPFVYPGAYDWLLN